MLPRHWTWFRRDWIGFFSDVTGFFLLGFFILFFFWVFLGSGRRKTNAAHTFHSPTSITEDFFVSFATTHTHTHKKQPKTKWRLSIVKDSLAFVLLKVWSARISVVIFSVIYFTFYFLIYLSFFLLLLLLLLTSRFRPRNRVTSREMTKKKRKSFTSLRRLFSKNSFDPSCITSTTLNWNTISG